MSTPVDNAPAAAPLELMDSNPAMFTLRDEGETPCTVTLPGSSNFNLELFDVTAIGTVRASGPGTLILTLYGRSNLDDVTTNPANWLPLASTPPEPIGAATDLPEIMFMFAGTDLLANTATGKIQGTFRCNVASNPQPPIDLEHHPGDATDEDPIYVFAVGASFTLTGAARTTAKAADAPLATLTLSSLTLSA